MVRHRFRKAIFENELEAWCLEVSWWPEHRGWDVFKSFFEVRFTSVVVDLAREALERDEPLVNRLRPDA